MFNVDESHVVAEAGPPRTGHCGSYLIAARFKLTNGTVLPGMVQVDVLTSGVECTPASVFAGGKKVDPLGRETATTLQRLLKTTHTQPMGWHLDVTLVGEREARSGPIGKPGLGQALWLVAQLARLKFRR